MHCEVTVSIPAPIELTWQIAQNPALRPKWDVRIARYEVRGEPGPGTEVRITFRAGLLRPTARAKFIRWAPPHQSGLQIERGTSSLVAAGAGSWTFKEQDGATVLTSRFTLQEQGLPWWMPKGLYRKTVELDTKRSFAKLRQLAIEQLKAKGEQE